jgi:hypothetical protein
MSLAGGVAAGLGFAAVSSREKEKVEAEVNTVEVELEASSVVAGCSGQQREFVKDGVTLSVKMNERGRLVLCAEGNESKATLRDKALTFAGRIQQAYSYDKAMTQLRQSGFNVVNESVEQDEEIHINLRRW